MNHSHESLTLFEQIFNKNDCHRLAVEHKFIQRSSSRLDGDEFVKALVLPSTGSSEDSLNGLCLRMRQFNSNADMSPQALSERINHESAPQFMRAVFARILQFSRAKIAQKSPELYEIFGVFSAVLIQDSTVCELNAQLKKQFQGTNRGGRSCTAQVKIDLIHNFTAGCIADVGMCDGNKPDQALSGRILDNITGKELIIRDLGYFSLNVLGAIDKKGAFFLSRLPPHVKVFRNAKDEYPIDLGSYLSKHHKNASAIDLKVFLGDIKLPARLVAYKAPAKVVKARLREAHKRAKGAKRTLSASKKALLKFSLFITNVSENIFPARLIGTVYRLRWEIELIFKQWKRQLKIAFLEGINAHRIECLIWARLCCTVLLAMVTRAVTVMAQQITDAEISMVKLLDYLLRESRLLRAVLQGRMHALFRDIMHDLPGRLCKDRRQRKTMRGKLLNSEGYYGCA